MEQPEPQRSRPRWINRGTIAAILVSSCLAAAVVIAWALSRNIDDRPVQFLRLQPNQKPHVVDGESTWLPKNAPVIGVRVGNRCRAYALSAMKEIDEHVLNDVLGGIPVTVAYCNITGCVRVFSDESRGQPLAVAVGGWVGEPDAGTNGVMLLRLDSRYFYQDSGEALDGMTRFPYSEIDFERTTWGAWRESHPETDVFAGPIRVQ